MSLRHGVIVIFLYHRDSSIQIISKPLKKKKKDCPIYFRFPWQTVESYLMHQQFRLFKSRQRIFTSFLMDRAPLTLLRHSEQTDLSLTVDLCTHASVVLGGTTQCTALRSSRDSRWRPVVFK